MPSAFSRRRLFGYVVAAALTLVLTGLPCDAALLVDLFNRPDGLLTNEYATYTPEDAAAARSSIWTINSGSIFVQGQAGWTGIPDDRVPNRTSSNGTGSCVFRLLTKRTDFKNVIVSFSLLNQGLTSSPSTPPVDWDGLHVWLRYQAEAYLYYCSINRRDNTIVIKKKIPGGTENGGTYYELSPEVPYRVPYGKWSRVRVAVRDLPDGSVAFWTEIDGQQRLAAVDNGTIAGPPIRAAGAVGLRGDNANLKFKDFAVDAFTTGSVSTPLPPETPPSLDTTSDPNQVPVLSDNDESPNVFPNPWRADLHSQSPIRFDSLGNEATVDIFTVSGHRIASLPSTAGQAVWNRLNDGGQAVASGLYLYVVTRRGHRSARGKLAIIR